MFVPLLVIVWLGWCLPGSFTVKLLFFSLQLHILYGDILKQCKYTVIPLWFSLIIFFSFIFQNGTGNVFCDHGFIEYLLWFCPSSLWLLCGQSAHSLALHLSYPFLQSLYSWLKKHTIIFILRSVYFISVINKCQFIV